MISVTNGKTYAVCQGVMPAVPTSRILLASKPERVQFSRCGYTEKVMSTLEPHTLASSWQVVEDLIAGLHELACAPIEPEEFYRRLLESCVATLAAEGGAVWLPELAGKWQVAAQVHLDTIVPADETSRAAHQRLLQQAALVEQPRVVLPGENNPTRAAILTGAARDPQTNRPQALIEIFLRAHSSPATQRGWEEFLAAVIHIVAQYRLHHELRTLRREQSNHDQVLGLLRRLHRCADLREVAYELANEGSRLLGGDRLSVLVRRGSTWQMLAASGTERLESRSDAVKDLQCLAQATAHWGEPLDYSERAELTELPLPLANALERHIDHSHARQLVAVPIQFQSGENSDHELQHAAVLVAETFGSEGALSRGKVVELAHLCEPALQQALEGNRWPIRMVADWTNRCTRLWERWGLSRLAIAGGVSAAMLLALIFVSTDFEIEAPATLMPRTVQDVFATTNGTVREVLVHHGEEVEVGTVLAVLDDPELDLESERVRGELATVRKRLEAIAVSRTDRQSRDELTPGRLPLSAEAKQLELRETSLLTQMKLLDKRREALTLRSPIGGTVLTLDVQNLLQTRPVERGQVLFTIADTNSGWMLEAEVPQDRIGHVIATERQTETPLTARFRLAGDWDHTYSGQVRAITETAVLDPAKLSKLPDVRVEIEADDPSLAAARPQMAAVVRIHCGRRSLGYVWLHDVWDTLYSRLAF